MRMNLGCFQTVDSDDQEVQKIVEGIHLSVNGEVTLAPKSHKWSVESMRHKTRKAYLVGKKNYLVTVSCVETYKNRAGHSSQATTILNQKDWEKHYEVEVLALYRIACLYIPKVPSSTLSVFSCIQIIATCACCCAARVCDEPFFLMFIPACTVCHGTSKYHTD